MTDGELRLMRVLWDKGEAHGRGSRRRAEDAAEARLQHRAHAAAHHGKEGLRVASERRARVHLPADGRPRRREPQRAAARSSTVSSTVRPRLLMLNLLEDAQLSPEALKQLKERIEEA